MVIRKRQVNDEAVGRRNQKGYRFRGLAASLTNLGYGSTWNAVSPSAAFQEIIRPKVERAGQRC